MNPNKLNENRPSELLPIGQQLQQFEQNPDLEVICSNILAIAKQQDLDINNPEQQSQLVSILIEELIENVGEDLIVSVLGLVIKSKEYEDSLNSVLKSGDTPRVLYGVRSVGVEGLGSHVRWAQLLIAALMMIILSFSSVGTSEVTADHETSYEVIAGIEEEYGVELNDVERIVFGFRMMYEEGSSEDITAAYFRLRSTCEGLNAKVGMDAILLQWVVNGDHAARIILPKGFTCVIPDTSLEQGVDVERNEYVGLGHIAGQIIELRRGQRSSDRTIAQSGQFSDVGRLLPLTYLGENGFPLARQLLGEDVPYTELFDIESYEGALLDLLERKGLCAFIYNTTGGNINQDSPYPFSSIPTSEGEATVFACTRLQPGQGWSFPSSPFDGVLYRDSGFDLRSEYTTKEGDSDYLTFGEDIAEVGGPDHRVYLVLTYNEEWPEKSLDLIAIATVVTALGLLGLLALGKYYVHSGKREAKKFEREVNSIFVSEDWGEHRPSISDIGVIVENPDGVFTPEQLKELIRVVILVGKYLEEEVVEYDSGIVEDGAFLKNLKLSKSMFSILVNFYRTYQKKGKPAITMLNDGQEGFFLRIIINSLISASGEDKYAAGDFWDELVEDSILNTLKGVRKRILNNHNVKLIFRRNGERLNDTQSKKVVKINQKLILRQISSIRDEVEAFEDNLNIDWVVIESMLRRLSLGLNSFIEYQEADSYQIASRTRTGGTLYIRPMNGDKVCLVITQDNKQQTLLIDTIDVEQTKWHRESPQKQKSEKQFRFEDHERELSNLVYRLITSEEGVSNQEFDYVQGVIQRAQDSGAGDLLEEMFIYVLNSTIEAKVDSNIELLIDINDEVTVMASRIQRFLLGGAEAKKGSSWRKWCKEGAESRFEKMFGSNIDRDIVAFNRPKLTWRSRLHLMLVNRVGRVSLGVVLTKHDH